MNQLVLLIKIVYMLWKAGFTLGELVHDEPRSIWGFYTINHPDAENRGRIDIDFNSDRKDRFFYHIHGDLRIDDPTTMQLQKGERNGKNHR